MPSQTIQWFPGHMAKTRRMISENLKDVDAVIEIRDARIPVSSQNPDIEKITSSKPRLILLNKASLADETESSKWLNRLKSDGVSVLLTDCIQNTGINRIHDEMCALCLSKLEKYENKGMSGRRLKVMVLGIPNVGKSSLINKLAGAKKARVEDKPGVTRDKQWIQTQIGIDMLDTPGVLWPKFNDAEAAENLAITGAIKDDILDTDAIAVTLIRRLRKLYPALLCSRYKLDDGENDFGGIQDWELFEAIARKRGFLLRGGDIDPDRTSAVLLDEFRAGKIGCITLDRPHPPKGSSDSNAQL